MYIYLQSENNPSMAMPTANPSQTIDLDKHEDGNVQKKKKRKS